MQINFKKVVKAKKLDKLNKVKKINWFLIIITNKNKNNIDVNAFLTIKITNIKNKTS